MSQAKVVLAYSGGLDTSVAIRWLQEKYHYDVIAVAVDVGEAKDLDFIREKALKVGAIESHVIDAKESFAKEFILPALKANALYEGSYPLISALSRPLIAKLLVNIAKQSSAQAIAHGCTGKGNDQVRFDVAIKALAPHLKIVAPVREAPMSREQAIAYAKDHDIPVSIQQDNPFSIDQNLWGRSCECGVLEDPWAAPPPAAYDWTVSPQHSPSEPQQLDITFKKGVPVALNGSPLSLHHLIQQVNQMAGAHGVGRIDHVENRLVGIKSREIYEAPGAMTLIKAHQALEGLTLTKDVLHFKPQLEAQFAKLAYEGHWYSPLKTAIDAFVQATQSTVSGVVRIQLYKGQATVIGRQSPESLYQFDLATYNPDDAFDHQAALGFIKLWGLPLEVLAKVQAQASAKEGVS